MLIPLITLNEIRRIWLQPLVWLILAGIFATLTLLFLVLLNNFYVEIQVKFAGIASAPGVTDSAITPMLFWSAFIGSAMLPIFCARITTEERVLGQQVLLSSAPISAMSIVAGKLLALSSVIIFLALLNIIFPLALSYYTNLDWGKIYAAIIGIILFQISFASLCVWLASYGHSIIFTVLASYGALLFLFILYYSGSSLSSESSLFIYLANFSHLLPMLGGLVDTKDIFYFVIMTFLFFSLSVVRLRYARH